MLTIQIFTYANCGCLFLRMFQPLSKPCTNKTAKIKQVSDLFNSAALAKCISSGKLWDIKHSKLDKLHWCLEYTHSYNLT